MVMVIGRDSRSVEHTGIDDRSSGQIMRGPMSQPRPTRRYVVGDGTTAGVGMALNRDGLERFAAVAASHVGEDKVPGLAALVAQGGDVHVEALGTLAVGGRPVERASLFRIASTTKPITAAATLALVTVTSSGPVTPR